MNAYRAAAVVTLSLAVVTGCAGTRPTWTPLAVPPSGAPQLGATAVPTTAVPASSPAEVAGARIVVTLTDAMKIEPGTMTVPAAEPVTFVVTNAGKIPHEFTVGDADVQDEHDQEMMSMGGAMGHDEANAISLAPGETKELSYTFATAGMSLAGCHVPGHYPAGMRATIIING